MKQIISNGVTLRVPDHWDEITLEQFINYIQWATDRPTEFKYDFEQLKYNFKLLDIFSFDNQNYDNVEVTHLDEIVASLMKLLETMPSFEMKESIIINNTLYSFIDVKRIKGNEYITYKTYQEMKPGIEGIPYLLAILCRPAEIIINQEFNKKTFKLKEFDPNDIDDRVRLLLKTPAFELMGFVSFFLSGKETLIRGLVDLPKKNSVMVK